MITVLRRQQGNGKTYYVAATKNHKGIYEHFTQKEVEGNPIKFRIQESGSLKKSETPQLPKALGELNEVIALLTVTRPNTSREKIVAAAEKMLADKKAYLRQRELKESWQLRGLTPEAAEIAASVESRNRPVNLPPATEWGNLLDRFGGRR
jgi:hypothetical protein